MAEAKCVSSHMLANSSHTLSMGDVLTNPELYRSTVAALQYLIITIPDISFVVNKSS